MPLELIMHVYRSKSNSIWVFDFVFVLCIDSLSPFPLLTRRQFRSDAVFQFFFFQTSKFNNFLDMVSIQTSIFKYENHSFCLMSFFLYISFSLDLHVQLAKICDSQSILSDTEC